MDRFLRDASIAVDDPAEALDECGRDGVYEGTAFCAVVGLLVDEEHTGECHRLVDGRWTGCDHPDDGAVVLVP